MPREDNRAIHQTGYPFEMQEALVEASERRFMENADKKGAGKAWLRDEARWHIWKACDELFQARDHANAHRFEQAMSHFADAFNHVLFAAEIVHEASGQRD